MTSDRDTAVDGLYPALLAFQAEAPTIQKDAINPHFRSRYVSLEALVSVALPLLNKHGLVLIQQPTAVGGDLVPSLLTKLVHAASGQSEQSMMPLALNGNVTPQAQGSAITYARRYALMAALGLVADEDDDANTAQEARQAGPDRASEAQVTALRAMVRKLIGQGKTDVELRAMVLDKYGVDGFGKLTASQADEAMKAYLLIDTDEVPF